MITLRQGRIAACLTLLSVCALIGVGQTARADINPTAQSGLTGFSPSTAIVKIDRAMLQEREAFPDGTIHLGTYLDAVPTQSAKSAPNAQGVARPEATRKA